MLETPAILVILEGDPRDTSSSKTPVIPKSQTTMTKVPVTPLVKGEKCQFSNIARVSPGKRNKKHVL